MKPIVADKSLIAACGLYCGACRSYLKGRCPGCAGNQKATWCTVRSCCQEHHFHTCAECKEFADPVECRKFHNTISKIIGVLSRSNRRACIQMIKTKGLDDFAAYMTANRIQTIKR